MARNRFVYREGRGLVEVDLDYKPRPRLAIHGVKPSFQSMADGKFYDDTRTYEREVRARGYEIVGDQKNFASPKPELPAPMIHLPESCA